MSDQPLPQNGDTPGEWHTNQNGERVFFPDYCSNGRHVAFEGKRVCYCGAVYFMQDLTVTL